MVTLLDGPAHGREMFVSRPGYELLIPIAPEFSLWTEGSAAWGKQVRIAVYICYEDEPDVYWFKEER